MNATARFTSSDREAGPARPRNRSRYSHTTASIAPDWITTSNSVALAPPKRSSEARMDEVARRRNRQELGDALQGIPPMAAALRSEPGIVGDVMLAAMRCPAGRPSFFAGGTRLTL